MKRFMIGLSAVCLAASLVAAEKPAKQEGKGEKAEKSEKGEAKQPSHGPVMSTSAIKKALLSLGLYSEALDGLSLTKDQREKVSALIEKVRPDFENLSKQLCSDLTGMLTEEQKNAFNRGMQNAQRRINMEKGILPAPPQQK